MEKGLSGVCLSSEILLSNKSIPKGIGCWNQVSEVFIFYH